MSPTGVPLPGGDVHRLAVGLEAVDVASGGRVPPPLHVIRDDRPLEDGLLVRLEGAGRDVASALPRFERHRTCRHVIRYEPGRFRTGHTSVTVRLVESTGGMGRRRFVPRRLEIPLLDPDVADDRDTEFRIRRPRLFPGAAYPVQRTATGLRGWVVRGDEIVRWARIEAVRSGGDRVLARAHGDDRGEFLLLLGADARPPGDPTGTVELEVRAFGPDSAPSPSSDLRARVDALWDLPVETLPEARDPDPVSRGEALPTGYGRSASRTIQVPLGRIVSEQQPFDIE